MRFLLILLALLLLPIFTLVHRYYYHQTMQGLLLAEVVQALSDPAYSNVSQHMEYLDVTLEGKVPDLAARERVRREIDSLHGVRCRVADNHIQVPAKLEGRLEGGRLTLSGSLHDDAMLRDVSEWLSAARPGLQLVTGDVLISPFVTLEDSPKKGGMTAFLRPLWSLIEVPASLKITKQGNALQAVGFLPDDALREAVITAVIGTKLETTLDDRQLKAGAYVKAAAFANAEALPALLKELFSTQKSPSFEADENKIRFHADVTDAIHAAWQPLLAKLGDERSIQADWKFFPSIYHLPNYQPESKLPPDALKTLRDALQQNPVQFEKGSSAVTPEEMLKLNITGQAILAAIMAAPETRIIVGAYPDVAGDTKVTQTMARRRAEAVVAEFVDRGLSARYFEIVPFSPPHLQAGAAATSSRIVELLVK